MAVRGLKRPNSVGGSFPLFPKVIHIPLKLALEYIIKKLSRKDGQEYGKGQNL